MPPVSVRDVLATAHGYQPGVDGLIGSGFERMLAYQRATDYCKALGIDPDMPLETLKRRLHSSATHDNAGSSAPTHNPNLRRTGQSGWDKDGNHYSYWIAREAKWLPPSLGSTS